MGKTASTDQAGICKDEGDVLQDRLLGWLCVVFAPLARCAAASRCWRASLRSAVVASTRAFASARTLSVQTGRHDTRDQVLSHRVGQVEATRRAQRTERTRAASREFNAPERASATCAARDRMLPAGAEDERSFAQRQHGEPSTESSAAATSTRLPARKLRLPRHRATWWRAGAGGKLKDLMAALKMLTEAVGGSRAETPSGRNRLQIGRASCRERV